MEYGKLQGEIAAAGHIAGATGSASLVGRPFNIAGATQISVGVYGVLLSDGVDAQDCVVNATCDTAPATATANNAGADTDTLKRINVVDAAGVASAASGFYIVVTRTN